jgi:hypothetical protein
VVVTSFWFGKIRWLGTIPLVSDDRAEWNLPPLAVEFEDVVDAGNDAISWAVARLRDGGTTTQLIQAAAWTALRRTPVEGRTIRGLVAHGVLASPAIDRIASRTSNGGGQLAAVGHVAYVAGTFGQNDLQHGPMTLRWFEPANSSGSGDAAAAFSSAAAVGDTELADHLWLALAASDRAQAEHELIRAAASGAHLNPHKVIYPAELRTWFGDSPLDPRMWRAAVRYCANYLQDPTESTHRWERASAMAGNAGPVGDAERVSYLADRAGFSSGATSEEIEQALAAGMNPSDVAEALSLGAAARYATTHFGGGFSAIGPIHATTGAAAVCVLVNRSSDEVLQCGLLDSLRTVGDRFGLDAADLHSLDIAPVAASLDDLRRAIQNADEDEAARVALTVPDEDAESAWKEIHDVAVTDQWLVQHAPKQSVALHDRYRACRHGRRTVYLAAAARTAALVTGLDQPQATLIRQALRKDEPLA